MIGYLNNTDKAVIESFDFSIVGAGAAGITLAVELSRKGHRVLLIEGGDWNESPDLLDTYVGNATLPHPDPTEYRYQRFGGTTHLWGGRCVPFDQHDFESRPHIPNSGWPEGAEDIASYYGQALAFCDAGNLDFEATAFGEHSPSMFEEAAKLAPDLNEYIERYSLPTDFGKKFKSELINAKHILVLLKTRCLRLNTNADESDEVCSITLSDGVKTVDIAVNKVILCGGGIDTTRLMLVSRKYNPSWSYLDESLGKYYACHYDLIFGSVSFKNEKPIFDFQKTTDGVYARRKLQFSAAFQAKHGLLNSAFRLHFPAYADPAHKSGILSAIFLAKSILKKEYQNILNHGESQTAHLGTQFKHVKNVVCDLPAVIKFGWDWLFHIKLAKRKIPYTLVPNNNGTYPLEFNSEQEPHISNCIELTGEQDNYGMERVKIHWKLTDLDIQSGISAFKLLKKLFEKTESCRLDFDLNQLEQAVKAALPVGGHHIGTTRMGHMPSTSVVDVNCKVHGLKNVYVASASVFTTNSHANPTLTIVALALRLSHHLSSQK